MRMYSARNLEMSIRFSLESRPSERFHRPEMSQIKAEIHLRTNVKLNFHTNGFEQNNLTENNYVGSNLML